MLINSCFAFNTCVVIRSPENTSNHLCVVGTGLLLIVQLHRTGRRKSLIKDIQKLKEKPRILDGRHYSSASSSLPSLAFFSFFSFFLLFRSLASSSGSTDCIETSPAAARLSRAALASFLRFLRSARSASVSTVGAGVSLSGGGVASFRLRFFSTTSATGVSVA